MSRLSSPDYPAGGAIVVVGEHGVVMGDANTDANQSLINGGLISVAGVNRNGVFSVGDNAVIENSAGGSISTSAAGISSNGAAAQISNSGSINTTGESGSGISAFGNAAQIVNSGSISTVGNIADGISSGGDDVQISNSGSISTIGQAAVGIRSGDAGAQIGNSGSISTTGQSGVGIDSTSSAAQIVNSGSISTIGLAADGIRSGGPDAQISNSGSISTTAEAAHGIASVGNAAQIGNCGSIHTTGLNAFGIYANGPGAVVTICGTVISEQSWAIRLNDPDATLNLLAGTAIQGGLFFTDPATATLNIGSGLNTALTFTTGADVPLDINLLGTLNSNGNPYVIGGAGNGVLAVVDATGFSSQGEMLGDLTGGVSGAVGGRLMAARKGDLGQQVAMNGMIVQQVADEAGQAAIWAKGIGQYRDQQAGGPDVGFQTLLGGIVAGFDTMVDADTRAGLFLGAATAEMETDGGSQEIDSDNWFGGLYAGWTGGRISSTPH